MRSLLTYHFHQLVNNPATSLFLAIGWAVAILLTFIPGGFIAANSASASILFGYLPWVMAVLIPSLTMAVAEEPARGVTERLLTLPHTPLQRLSARFLVYWLLLAVWLCGFAPFIGTLYYLGHPDAGPILLGMLGQWLAAAPLLAVSLAICLHARGGVRGLLLSMGACLALVAVGSPLVLGWLGAIVPPPFTYMLATSATLGAALAPFTNGVLPLGGLLFLGGLTLLFLSADLLYRARTNAIIFACAGLVFIAGGVSPVLGRFQVDATAEHLYTLSPSTLDTLQKLTTPVTFTLYWSRNNPDVPPQVATSIQSVVGLLQRMQAVNPGKITIATANPEGSTAAANAALQAGAEEQPLPKAGTGYFAALAAVSGGNARIIPALTPARGPYAEFDVMQLLAQVQQHRQPSTVVITAQALGNPRWLQALGKLSSVTTQSPDQSTIPADTSLVLVWGDPALPAATQQALQAYLGGGGHVLLVADPLWRTNPAQPAEVPNSQPFSNLLPQWGITYNSQTVVADVSQPAIVNQPGTGGTAYPLWVNLEGANLNPQLPFTNASPVIWAEGGTLTLAGSGITPILTTSAQAQTIAAAQLQTMAAEEAASRLASPKSSHVLAALAATGPGTLMVYADADWLSDTLTEPSLNYGNLALFTGSLEYMLGQGGLTALRGKGANPRTLTRVQALFTGLTQQTTRLEQKLIAQIYQASQGIEQVRSGGILQADPEAQIAEYKQQQFALRQQLRALRQTTRRKLFLLENSLLALNLAASPFVLTVAMLIHRRRKRLKS